MTCFFLCCFKLRRVRIRSVSAGAAATEAALRGRRCATMSLADVLHPLPISALGAFLVSFSNRRGDAALIHQDLRAAGLLHPAIQARDLEEVVYKLQVAHPDWLQPKGLLSSTCLRLCPQCGCQLHCKQVGCHILTFAAGLQPFTLQRETCETCNVVLCGHWKWAVGSSGRASLRRPVAPEDIVLLTLWPEASSVAAMDPALFAFLTASLLHVRSSFRGFASLMEDFHAITHREHLHDKLLYSWIVHKAVLKLQEKHWDLLQQVPFCFQRHRADLRCETLGALYLPLQQAFLEDFAMCDVRSPRSPGF